MFKAAERRAAQKVAVPELDEVSESSSEHITGEDMAEWKAQEAQRERREAQLEAWPVAPEPPPVSEPCLDVLKAKKSKENISEVFSELDSHQSLAKFSIPLRSFNIF